MKKSIFLIIALVSIFGYSFIGIGSEIKLLKTSLKITVLNELGNPVEDVVLKLYKTEKDYEDETNMVGDSALTDDKGRATFRELDPTIYFVSAEKGKQNNHGAGIQTNPLESGKVNKVNIVID